MALDWLSLSDPELINDYNRPIHDPERARKPIVASLDKAAEQFSKLPEKTKGRKMWSISNTTVKLTLPFAVKGTTEHYFPSERFLDILKAIKAEITAGKHDEAIEAGAGEASVSQPTTGTRRKRGPMTEEQKAERRRKMEQAGTFGKGGRAKAS